MGTLGHDVRKNPRHDDEYDLEGQRINTMGYLIDEAGNIVDRWSKNIVFQKEVLEDRYGQEAEIPYVFRCGKLKKPEDEIERAIRKKLEAARTRGAAGQMGDGLDWDGESEELMDDLEKIERRQKEHYGMRQDGMLAAMVDAEGDEI